MITIDQKRIIFGLTRKGYKISQIAKVMNISRGTVYRYQDEFPRPRCPKCKATFQWRDAYEK